MEDCCCPVVELRQYTLRATARETLIGLFDEHFVDGQERCGMRAIGQFRDLDDPDRFVWLRGFADMEARTRALEAFYGTAGFPFDPRGRPAPGSPVIAGGLVIATIERAVHRRELLRLQPTPRSFLRHPLPLAPRGRGQGEGHRHADTAVGDEAGAPVHALVMSRRTT